MIAGIFWFAIAVAVIGSLLSGFAQLSWHQFALGAGIMIAVFFVLQALTNSGKG